MDQFVLQYLNRYAVITSQGLTVFGDFRADTYAILRFSLTNVEA